MTLLAQETVMRAGAEAIPIAFAHYAVSGASYSYLVFLTMASAAKAFGAGLALQSRCEANQAPSQDRDKRLCRLQALVRLHALVYRILTSPSNLLYHTNKLGSFFDSLNLRECH